MSRKPSSKKAAASSPPAGAFIEQMMAQLAASRVSESVDDAQSIMFDAWESARPAERVRLARKALKVSADCADAYVLLAQETATTPAAAAELYAEGVAGGG